MIRPIICSVLLAVMILLAIGPSNIFYFIDAGSFIFVVPSTFLFLYMVFGRKLLLLIRPKPDPAEQQVISRIGSAGILASLGLGGLGTITGFILMLQNLDCPSALGPGFAVSGLTSFYSILLSVFIFLPLIITYRKESSEKTDSIYCAAVLLLPFIVMCFVFLLISLAFSD